MSLQFNLQLDQVKKRKTFRYLYNVWSKLCPLTKPGRHHASIYKKWKIFRVLTHFLDFDLARSTLTLSHSPLGNLEKIEKKRGRAKSFQSLIKQSLIYERTTLREKKVILVDAPPSCVHSHHSWEDGKKEERAISNGSISCRRRGSLCLCHNNTFCDRFTRLEDRFERKIVLTTFTSTSSKSVVAYVVALLLCSQQESKHHAPSTYSSIAVAFLLYVFVCVCCSSDRLRSPLKNNF